MSSLKLQQNLLIIMSDSPKKITKRQVIKKGKAVLGSNIKFNIWLNSEHITLGCKPITLWNSIDGLKQIYDYLSKVQQRSINKLL